MVPPSDSTEGGRPRCLLRVDVGRSQERVRRVQGRQCLKGCESEGKGVGGGVVGAIVVRVGGFRRTAIETIELSVSALKL